MVCPQQPNWAAAAAAAAESKESRNGMEVEKLHVIDSLIRVTRTLSSDNQHVNRL